MERALKAGGLAAGMVGLLVLVAIAARGGHPGTNGDVATRAVPDSVQDGLVTVMAVLYVIAIVAIIFGLHRYPNRFRDPESRWFLNFALVVVLMLVATAVGYFAIRHGYNGSKDERQQNAGVPGTTPNGRFRSTAVPSREAHFQWPLAAGIGGLILLAGVWMYVRTRRELAPRDIDATLESDLAAAIETTIDDLRSERDARKAVIAAYALMERTLTTHGLPRDRAETPLEYLGRILRALHVRESAVRTLTSLFEYAKFSRHEIDAAMKEDAVVALVAVRDDVRREDAEAA
ncbi:MAG: DUF4129 domain-containing protein [Gaiellaceae bacterium]